MIKKFHWMMSFHSFASFIVCLKPASFASWWKFARAVTIPKWLHYSLPHLNNIRCINLLSCLGKRLKNFLAHRHSSHLAYKDVICTNKYGFIPHKSIENALAYLCDIVSNEKRNDLCIILVFMGIKRAFNNAWWPAITIQLKLNQ